LLIFVANDENNLSWENHKKIMIHTVTIDVINNNAMKLLQELERLRLIHIHTDAPRPTVHWATRHKGTMSKQPLADIDNQLDELRNGWE
jgi:hypothetical protein